MRSSMIHDQLRTQYAHSDREGPDIHRGKA